VLFWQIVVEPAILAVGKGLTVINTPAEALLLQATPLDSCTLAKEYMKLPGVPVGTLTVTLLPEEVTIDWSDALFIL
jgi:hypothetical protein